MNNYVIPQSERKLKPSTSLQERAEKAALSRESYSKFVDSIPATLMAETMNFILQKSLDEGVSESDRELGKVLCEQYVSENNCMAMLRRFKTKSQLLAEAACNIEKSSAKIISDTDKNALNFSIKPSDKKDFYKGLEDLSVDEVCKKINKRVCDAAEEFIQNNINDKLDMEELAQKTKEKIDAVKASTPEMEEKIKQEHANLYHEKINNIANGTSRRKNVYEQMVNTAATTAVKNKEQYGAFINESGKLDVDKITEKVHVMYTFLEMLNTAKIRDIDETYVQECINSIK